MKSGENMNQTSYTRYLGTVLDDRYQILEKIGEGGMARVYRAMDTRLNREVAVKIVREELFADEEVQRRFYAEAHAVAQFSHPNIVAIYDVSRNDERGYIVMELITGITLRQYLDRKKTVPWKQVFHFSRQIADALDHAHQRGIIHRDIKPMNLMLLSNGTIKVADFGIAAFENELRETREQAFGSLHYIAPEQLRGRKADARGDVYSLGVTMYELLTGYQPYSGDTPAEVLQNQSTGAPLPMRAFDVPVPPEFEEIVLKAMATDEKKRYQSAAELKQALNRLAEVLRRSGRAGENTAPIKVAVSPSVDIPHRDYVRSIRRANRIGYSLGSFALLATMIAVFILLWDFWLRDVFTQARRMELPNFVGSSYETIVKDVALTSQYNFSVNYIVDTSAPAGTVLSQEPEAGRSLMVTENGMNVKLNVSTGYVLTPVPNVNNYNYREAMLVLRNAGFEPQVNQVTSSSVEKDLVIATNPAAGERISAGSTVYLTVSAGAQISYVKMPNLIGLSEDAAVLKLQNAGLTYGGSERRSSEYEAGTVIAQSIVAFAEVEELTRVTLTISSGQGVFY